MTDTAVALTPAERIARAPIATAIATLPQGLTAGSAAERVLAAIRDAGLILVDDPEAGTDLCQCAHPRKMLRP